MAIKHLFFDLDGTLVDSLPGISFSATEALARVCPGKTAPDFSPFIGPPIREIFQLALQEEDGDLLDRLCLAFRQSYDSQGWTKTEVYPGVNRVIASLHDSGMICRVLTNKPLVPTLRILRHLALDGFMSEVITPDKRSPGFTSKIEAARDAQNRHSLTGTCALVVGDSSDDCAAAEACGFQFAAVAYGYGAAHRLTRPSVHFRIERFADLLDVVWPSRTSSIGDYPSPDAIRGNTSCD